MASEPRVEDLLATIRRAIDKDINELDRRAQDTAPAAPPLAQRHTRPHIDPRNEKPVSPATPLRGTLNDFHDKYQPDADADIARLRNRVRASRPEEELPPVAPPRNAPERTSSFSTIMKTPQRPEPQFRSPQQPAFRPAPQPEPLYPEAEEVQPQAYESYEQYDPNQQWQNEQEVQQGYYPPAVPEAYQDPNAGLMSPDPAFAAHASFQALAQLALHQIGGDAGLQHMTREVLTTLLREWLDRNLPPLVEALVREEIERVARGGR